MTIMCRNDELSSTMSRVGYLLKDSKLCILFAENSQILKISVIPILLAFSGRKQVNQLTVFQPGRADYPHLLLLAPSKFFTFRGITGFNRNKFILYICTTASTAFD